MTPVFCSDCLFGWIISANSTLTRLTLECPICKSDRIRLDGPIQQKDEEDD